MSEKRGRKRSAPARAEQAKRLHHSDQVSDTDSDGEETFGQRPPPLIEYIKGILTNYPDGSQILKEMIQNADDAGATKVEFLLDYTTHSSEHLIKPICWLYQGQALYAWNNASFKAADWKGIQSVGMSSKAKDTLKVGRFGLGFVAVYHITDVPTFVSDDSVGILDPQQRIYPNEAGKKIKLKTFFNNSKYASHQSCFASYFQCNKSPQYNGTIFRFPLRKKECNSLIKPDGVYDTARVKTTLFEPLKKEADSILIFLKNVKSIKLSTKGTLKKDEFKFFVEVADGFLKGVERCNSSLQTHASEQNFHNQIKVTVSLYPITSSSSGDGKVWLVLNLLGYPQYSEFKAAVNLDYLPWIGIAMETGITGAQLKLSHPISLVYEWDGNNLNGFINDTILRDLKVHFTVGTGYKLTTHAGKLFCFLPTPESSHLPFSLHGYFALSNDRRRIKWPTLDSNDNESNWNKLLIKHLGVSAYVMLYRILVQCFHHESPEDYQYRLLNGEFSDPTSLSGILVNQGLDELVGREIVYSCVTKQWMKVSEGLYHSQQYENIRYDCNATESAIEDLMTFLQQPLVHLPDYVINVFNANDVITNAIDCNTITPVRIRQIMLHQKGSDLIEYFVDNIKRDTLIILAFILSDLKIDSSNIPLSLNSIPLLINNSSKISWFSTNSKFPLFIYQRNMNLIQLFPGAEHRFVDTSIPPEIYSFLLKISQKFANKINLKDITNLQTDTLLMKDLFETCLNSCSCQNWYPNNSPHNRTWIKLVWSFIGSDVQLARKLGSLCLLPKEDLNSVKNQLLPIIPAGDSCVYTFYSNIKKYKPLEDTLVKSGVVFLHSNRCIECLDGLVIKPIPDGFLTILETNNNILKLFISKLKCTNKEDLFSIIVDVLNKNTLSHKHKNIIQRLPIFPNMNSKYVSLANSGCVRVPAGLQLPSQLEYPPTYLAPNLHDLNTLYDKLDTQELSINNFVEMYLIIFIQRMGKFSFELSVCLLKNLTKFSDRVINKLRNLNCILDNRSDTPVSCKPSSLFDPDDVIMRDLLPPDSCYFPNTRYSTYFNKTKLKHLFNTSTRLKNQSVFEEVIQTVLNSFKVLINSQELWESKFKQFLRFLYTSWKNTDLETWNIFTNTLLRHQIVLPLTERPPSYPNALKFVGKRKLYTLESVVFCTDNEIQLIAGSEICVPIFSSLSNNDRCRFESLLKHLNCCISVTGEMLVKQLNIICKTKFPRSDTQNIHSILCEVYNSESIFDLRDEITENFVFVRSKNIFINPLEISKNLRYPLEPYYYSFDNLNYPEEAWRLFSERGAVEDISATQLYTILDSLYHGKKNILKSLDNHTIARIIEDLSECKDELDFEEYFLLCSDDLLHVSTDCLVSNSKHYQNQIELVKDGKTYFIVSSLISETIAQMFGAESVKDILLGNSMGFYEFVGQYEDLTTRIKSILKDYESSIDVFKEMVQNADDAQANTVKLLIDYHSYPSEALVEPMMKHWQGPALYIYNDAQFTEEDFKNIMKIFGETKIDDTMKIGKFGLGFNTVYHLTDVPSFVSGRLVHILDPHRKYIAGGEIPKPGIRIDFIANKDSVKKYNHQFDVFNLKLFECNILKPQPYNGTLFRLPFRSDSVSSEISNNTYDKSQISKLLSKILREAESSIRFLQHVTCIEVYERKDTSKEVLKLRVSKKVVSNSFPKHETFISRNLEHINSITTLETDPVSSHQLITISTENCKQETSEKYLLSFSTGTEQCKQFLLIHSEGVKYTPVCSIAFPVSGIGQSDQDSLCKTMYCFLPLPITSPYPMLINGCFALDQSRRGIACTQDGSVRTKWNQTLINDALVNAFINLLIQIRSYFSPDSKSDISLYYSLWPLSIQSHILWEKFPESFADKLIRTDVDLFYNELSQDNWTCYSDVNFIVYGDYDTDKNLKDLFVFARKKYLDKNINLIEIKMEIQKSHLFQIILQNDTDKIYTLERMCRDLILPEIHSFTLPEVNLILTTLLPLILLPNQDWLKELISQTQCIPCGCKTNYSSLPPTRVVSPHSTVAKLYYPTDQRTIHPELSELFSKKSDSYRALKKLDVIENILPVDDVIDRCKYQLHMSISKREEHSMTILQYLNLRCTSSPTGYNKMQLSKLRTELLKIEFIPVWKDDFLTKLGLQQYNGFATPPECSPYALRYITPLDTYNVTQQVDTLSVQLFLNLDSTSTHIHIDSLISLLHTLHDEEEEIHRFKLEQELGRRAEQLFTTIYSHWVSSKRDKKFSLSENITTLKWIWHKHTNSFCHVSDIVTSDRYSRFKTKYLPTFPYEVDDDPNIYRIFFKTLGVRTNVSSQEAYNILSCIAGDYKDKEFPSDLFVEFIISLTNNSLKDYTCYDNMSVLLSSNEKLCLPSELKVDDMTWSKAGSSKNKQTKLVHDDIHPRVAFNLGATSIRSNNFTKKEFTITDFGQHEDIGDRINNLKREFPCDVTIFKELLQNAEDAGATEVVFVLDEIDYSEKKESLCFSKEEHPNWQDYQNYSSLLVYNDCSFGERDIEGIQSLGLGGKKDQHTIGKFGLGFNAVYHLTDSPCLLTRRQSDKIVSFCVFDPFRKFLKIRSHDRPGIRLNFTSAELKRFPDQFYPYSFKSVPDLTERDYSILKLPLTNEDVKMEDILTNLISQVSDYIIFLRNIQNISVMRRDKDGTHILGEVHVTVTQSTQLPHHYLTNYSYRYLDNVDIFIKEISTERDVSPSASRKRKTHNPENTSSWLLFTNNGNIEQLERSCADVTTHKLVYEKEKLTQVYGGVAVELPIHSWNTSRVGGSCLYSYLPIGSDTPSKFPVLINAPFILQPERQLIRFRDVSGTSPGDWVDIWHSVIIKHVITPLFVSLLLYLKDESRLENILEHVDSQIYYNWYYSLYPNVVNIKKGNEQNTDLLSALCKRVYTALYNRDENILVDHTYENWFCLHGNCNGVFNVTPYSSIPGKGNISSAKRAKNSNANSLSLCLYKVKFPLTSAPNHIYASFHECSHTLTQLNPSYLLTYLNDNTHNWCIPLRDASALTLCEIEVLLSYILTSNWVVDPTNIPLRVDQDGNLGSFSKSDITLKSEYSDLLPHCADKFIHSDFPNSCIHKLVMNNYIRNLTVDFLSNDLRPENFKSQDHCLFWKFIFESGFQCFDLMKKFGKYHLIPVKDKSKRSFTLVSNLSCVLNQNKRTKPHSKTSTPDHVVSQHDLYNALIKMNCPELCLEPLNIKPFDVSQLFKYLSPSTICNEITTQSFLAAVKLSTMDVGEINLSEAKSLRNLFNNSDLNDLPPEDIRFISSLKIFLSNNNELCSIADFRGCYITNPKLTIGNSVIEILNNNNVRICKDNERQNSLIHILTSKLGINLITENDLFLNFIIPNFTQLGIQEQTQYLLYIQSSISQSSPSPKKDYISKLTSVKFIHHSKTGILCSVNEFYSHKVELFKVFFPDDILPTGWCDGKSCFRILCEIGLRHEIDFQSILKAAILVQNNSKEFTTEELILPLSSLANVSTNIIKSYSQSELNQLSRIAFLPVSMCNPSNGIFVKNFSTFENAELSSNKLSCYTASYVHDPLVDTLVTNTHNSYQHLKIRLKPRLDTVIEHFEKICLNFTQLSTNNFNLLRNMFSHTYQYLNTNCSDKNCLKGFKNIPCVFYQDRLFFPRNMVFSLDTILSSYLFKVPDTLSKYRSLLQLIGVAETPNHTHYSAVLNDICNDVHFTDKKKREEMSVRTFSLFISSLRELDTPAFNLDPVTTMVLADDMSIVSLQNVVYVDNTTLKTHIEHFTDPCNIKFLHEISPDSFGSCKPPKCLGVRYLSEIIVEQLVPGKPKISSSRQRSQLEYLIKCTDFAKGLVRIYYAGTKGSLKSIRIKNGIVKGISKEPSIANDEQFLSVFEMLHELSVKMVDSISVNVTHTQTGECITRNNVYDCYIDKSVLYVTSDKMSGVSFYHLLTNALNTYLANVFSQMQFNLNLCLSCNDVSTIMQILDSHNVQTCPPALLTNLNLPAPPPKPKSSKLPTPQQPHRGVNRHTLLSLMNTTPNPVTPSPGHIVASPHDKFTAKLWIRTAQCDLRAAEKLISEDSSNALFPPHACTNCFECAMKTCIAVLYIHKYRGVSIPCQRNLDILLDLVKTHFESPHLFNEFSSNCIYLLNFDENAKNPFMIPGSCCIPMEHISLTTAKEAIKNATNLLEVVKKEFPTFTELMYKDDDVVWDRPTSQSLLITQFDNFEISPTFQQQELDINCEEYCIVARNFFQTLPDRTIHSIIKVHNKVCWDNFVKKVKQHSESSQNTLLIKPLFHGSSGTDPQVIMQDNVGFRTEKSRCGMWGHGIYFAVNASYSDKNGYAYVDKDNQSRSIFLSNVFVGNPKFETPNRKITKPPKDYHSVTGITDGTTVYILYEDGLAYPGYLINYK